MKLRDHVCIGFALGGLLTMLLTSHNGYLTLPGFIGFLVALAAIWVSFS